MRPILVDYTEEFLNLSWTWLNDGEIRKLTDTPLFDIKDQKQWYSGIRLRSDYLIWGIEINLVKIGACGLKNITKEDCQYWCYIGEKEYWSRGIGTIILEMLIAKAKELQLSSIWLKVNNTNIRALNLYEKCRFSITGMKDDIIIMRKKI